MPSTSTQAATGRLLEKAGQVEDLIKKYCSYVLDDHDGPSSQSIHTPGPHNNITTPPQEMDEVVSVIITGSTGHLGCYVLSSLLKSSKVATIYALNRKGDEPLRDRQVAAFLDKELSPLGLLQEDRIKLYEVDLSAPDFGLPRQVYLEMRQSASIIIHLAWPVTYKWPLERFEGVIRGTCNLIRFARSCHHAQSARFLFGSTTVTVLGWEDHTPIPETVLQDVNFALAHGTGYAEAKYIIDRVLEQAHINSTSIRLGQLCGSKYNGVWNTTEWVPLIVKSSIALGSMPHIMGSNLWVHIDIAGQCISEIALSATRDKYPPVFNLTTHVPMEAHQVMKMIHAVLLARKVTKTPLAFIPAATWLDDVSKYASMSSENMTRAPASKISDIIRSMLVSNDGVEVPEDTPISDLKEYGCFGPFVTRNGKNWSRTFRDMKQLELGDVRGWVDYWIKKDLLRNPSIPKLKL